ncbi:hypothetical protein GCM10023340_32460 [Nocardioides marinquilinus]|uniref:HTH marR-type domain-containing protein n=1 Tax=Nocardioides marinquilinus TaxID=1210400 RepID=A0ABP9PUH6_9ACTN
MVSVKGERDDEPHVADLLGALFADVGAAFAGEEWRGLRLSHLRLLQAVPRDGTSVTDLAARLGMTKQGCGQLVAPLVASGHLTSEPHPDDARVRVVRRTRLGDQRARAVTRGLARLEDRWRERVGERRYATFRGVLVELAAASDEPAPE